MSIVRIATVDNVKPMMSIAKPAIVDNFQITEKEFNLFRKLIYDKAGISMAETKRGLVQGRLTKRLRHYRLRNFSEYYDLINRSADGIEMQMLVDLLTTNETYFYREQKHFDFVAETVIKGLKKINNFKIWSAACSSGEEPYSLAMLVADKLGINGNWDILATDLNQQILDTAKRGLYRMSVTEKIPQNYLREYCLQGQSQYSDFFMLCKAIRSKIDFQQLNLNSEWNCGGPFDLIVLRNVMIYFDSKTREKLVARMANKLKPNGYLFVSHSETLSGINGHFKCVQPAIYRLK